MLIINNKKLTIKQFISEFITVITFILLSIAFKAYSCSFNEELLLSEDLSKRGEYLHKECDTINPKDALKCFARYNSRLEPSIDLICSNSVGKTMIRRMYDAYLSAIDIGRIFSIEIRSGAKSRTIRSLSLNDVRIDINPDVFYSGVGYMGNQLKEVKFELDSVIFHELCHAFHRITKIRQNTTKMLDFLFNSEDNKLLWTTFNPERTKSDEELYTITGYFYQDGNLHFDPINANLYEICKQSKTISNEMDFFQRILHINYRKLMKHGFNPTQLILDNQRILIHVSNWILDEL